jgi:predicted transcriptional regulator
MRTTIDLPEDLHRIARSIAHDRKVSLSRAVADLLRQALDAGPHPVDREIVNGLPVIRLGRPVTSEDVRALEDDE